MGRYVRCECARARAFACVFPCCVRWALVKGQQRLDASSSQVHEDDRLVSVDGVVVRGMTPQEVLASFLTPRLTHCEHTLYHARGLLVALTTSINNGMH